MAQLDEHGDDEGVEVGGRRKLQFFGRDSAREAHETPMLRTPEFDQPALDALPEFGSAGGSRVLLLFGDPESPDDGGMSLVSVRFAPNYVLPRHSHSVDCLYFIHAGSIRMGSRTFEVGDGFFAPAETPYGYTAGPQGVELLEFRNVSAFDSRIRESQTGWQRILETVRANRDDWAEHMVAGTPGQW